VNEAIFLPTAVLFAGAALEIVLGGVLSRTAKGWLAVAIALAALAAACPLLPAASFKYVQSRVSGPAGK